MYRSIQSISIKYYSIQIEQITREYIGIDLLAPVCKILEMRSRALKKMFPLNAQVKACCINSCFLLSLKCYAWHDFATGQTSP